ncbi:MAG: MBL fold metallo-hydrolase [bacterium]|nr:MBL fold metallo-hydrolase [bacterium]
MSENVTIRFWGVRGSVPSPINAQDVQQKKIDVLTRYQDYLQSVKPGQVIQGPAKFVAELENIMPSTYGGNTSCVEVRYEDQIFILDMGTGLLRLGNSLIPSMFKGRGLEVDFVLSHVHWDHIQGLPFFGPLFINKASGVNNKWHFHGGTGWQKTAETCLKNQMDFPNFPVSFTEIEKITGEKPTFEDMFDQKQLEIGAVRTCFRKLDHPQETYGSQLTFPDGKIVAYTTDNEPRDPSRPDPKLVALAKNANVWITDCQYTKDQYEGEKTAGGVARHGWGHSYPEAVAKTAVIANVERVILFHHDPMSSDEKVKEMERYTQELIKDMGGKSTVTAAWEGLEITL